MPRSDPGQIGMWGVNYRNPTEQEKQINKGLKIARMVLRHPVLAEKLAEALEADRFFITVTFQKKNKPTDRNDLHHTYVRRQFMVDDAISSLEHITNDFKAKEKPDAEIKGDDWH